MNAESLLEPVRLIARRAGAEIMRIYATDFAVENKADESPLTAADLASHRAIVAGLTELTPELPILSEESAQQPFSERKSWQRYWLVDPLDGTKEFVKRNGEFTVNIALIEGTRPVLGVVSVPVTETDYYGVVGRGAYKRVGESAPVEVSVRSGSGHPRVVGSRSHRGASLQAFLANLGDHEMVPMGSSLKFCVVAEGGADIYPRLGPTSEWDTGAAQAVVESAGGQVVTLDGAPLAYNTKEDILNPHFMVIGDTRRDWLSYL